MAAADLTKLLDDLSDEEFASFARDLGVEAADPAEPQAEEGAEEGAEAASGEEEIAPDSSEAGAPSSKGDVIPSAAEMGEAALSVAAHAKALVGQIEAFETKADEAGDKKASKAIAKLLGAAEKSLKAADKAAEKAKAAAEKDDLGGAGEAAALVQEACDEIAEGLAEAEKIAAALPPPEGQESAAEKPEGESPAAEEKAAPGAAKRAVTPFAAWAAQD